MSFIISTSLSVSKFLVQIGVQEECCAGQKRFRRNRVYASKGPEAARDLLCPRDNQYCGLAENTRNEYLLSQQSVTTSREKRPNPNAANLRIRQSSPLFQGAFCTPKQPGTKRPSIAAFPGVMNPALPNHQLWAGIILTARSSPYAQRKAARCGTAQGLTTSLCPASTSPLDLQRPISI